LGGLALAAPAAAASPEFCTLYAQEYADQQKADADQGDMSLIRDKAYYKCLNMDDEPQLPSVAATVGKTDTVQVAVATKVAEPEQTGSVASVASLDESVEPPAPAATKSKKGRRWTSGHPKGSKEWVAWCSANYKSFDPKTGYYKPFDGPKVLCK
jgi:hypothetical protein